MWKGNYKLHLAYLPEDQRVTESESSLHIDADPLDKYATITYVWHHEGKRHEGTLLMTKGDHSAETEIGWVDSWHQSTGVMLLKGEEESNGDIKTHGSFAAGKETWGWTTNFEFTADHVTLRMDVISPAGETDWAVAATYTRA